MVLNTIATELEKATDLNREDLEKEILEFVNFNESLEKYTCAKQSSVIRSQNVQANALEIPYLSNEGLTQEWIPFFATSSLCQLMKTAISLHNSERSRSSAASQNHSQLPSRETSKCFKIIRFVLNSSLHHIRSYCTGRKEEPLKTLIYGEINLMGPPLLKLICLLNSGPKLATDQKKEMKGKKDVEGGKEHLHLALICLKELITISLKNSHSTSLLEDLLSVSTLKYEIDEEDEEISRIADQQIRIKMNFIVKILRPLITELLAQSSFHEIEVHSLSVPHLIHLSC